jgi:hypothetical protein
MDHQKQQRCQPPSQMILILQYGITVQFQFASSPRKENARLTYGIVRSKLTDLTTKYLGTIAESCGARVRFYYGYRMVSINLRLYHGKFVK